MSDWRKTIERIHEAACAVLKEHGLPMTYEELITHNNELKGRLVNLAALIVYSCHWVEKELAIGRCERALDRLTSVYTYYDDFFLLANVPELESDPLIRDDVITYITKGKKRFGWQSGGRKTPEETTKQWQIEYQQILEENPGISKRKAANIINPVKAETIRRKI